ncbi:MAG TPA: DUF2938 family protein [Gammaproteobacteria bacterium]|nr:DUF2938 family protein [Gammaproteobacteria bacterium]HIM99307.1 DUF2938 family protein [Gammaproteobacteria bacterium]
MDSLIYIFLAGVFATAAIDIWAEFLGKVFKLPVTNWSMVGRWFGHMPRGKFIHDQIKNAAPITGEKIIGWSAHYIIGVIYAAFFFLVIVPVLGGQPSLGMGLAFGLATIFFPWLVMQPGLGLGVFARRVEKPNVIRMINLSIHTIFGVSLYLGWLLVGNLNFGLK